MVAVATIAVAHMKNPSNWSIGLRSNKNAKQTNQKSCRVYICAFQIKSKYSNRLIFDLLIYPVDSYHF